MTQLIIGLSRIHPSHKAWVCISSCEIPQKDRSGPPSVAMNTAWCHRSTCHIVCVTSVTWGISFRLHRHFQAAVVNIPSQGASISGMDYPARHAQGLHKEGLSAHLDPYSITSNADHNGMGCHKSSWTTYSGQHLGKRVFL